MIKNSGQFKKGMIPWNKGKVYYQILGHPNWNKGIYKHSKTMRKRLSLAKMGKNNSNYKKYRVTIKECFFCKKEFRGKLNIFKFCSRKCADMFRRGKHFSSRPKELWVSPLVMRIKHSIEYINWRKQIFKRDNYTCQGCFKKGNGLNAHHIKSFSKILREFLNQYNQFSPFEDIDILLRLSFGYQSFWDIGNGITYCEECHKKTKNFARNLPRGDKDGF